MITTFVRVKRLLNGAFLLNTVVRLVRLAMLVLFLVLLYYAYRYSLRSLLHGSFVLGFLILWVLVAYITLPRLHRWLTKIYLPDYYMGRARTSEGLLGDPINIAIHGSAKQLRETMQAAGWVEADRIRLRTALRIVHAVLFNKSYPAAPGNTLFLFGYRQTFSFQKEENGNPRSRRHVRFWKTPAKWWLPGGYTADWLGAVHHDQYVGISLFTGQFTHRVYEDTDGPRDDLVKDLVRVNTAAKIAVVEHFSSGYHARNGGGDRMRTDGSMPFVDLRKS
jgi:hypothetical protein